MVKMLKAGSPGIVGLRLTAASSSVKTSMVAAATADEGSEFHKGNECVNEKCEELYFTWVSEEKFLVK